MTRSLLAALAAGLLSVAVAAPVAHAGASASAPMKNQLAQHVFMLGSKTIVHHGPLTDSRLSNISEFSSASRRSGSR